MYLSVGTTWDDRLLFNLGELNRRFASSGKVTEIYGSLRNDIVGTVRESARLPPISMSDISRHAGIARLHGMQLNYTLNSTVVSPAFLHGNADKLVDFVKELREAGVSSLTIASPALIKVVRTVLPDIPIYVSTAASVASLSQARYFEELGVSKIKLSVMSNRDFHLLTALMTHLRCDIELLLNECCPLFCPLRSEHFSIQSISRGSERMPTHEQEKLGLSDYPYSECSKWLFDSESFPVEFIKAPWIRPEDVSAYEAVGIHHFKVTGRTMPSMWVAGVVEAYLSREHQGNLLDLFPLVGSIEKEGREGFGAFIANSALRNFLSYFVASRPRCDVRCGTSCTYCHRVAAQLLRSGAAWQHSERDLPASYSAPVSPAGRCTDVH